MQTWRSQPSVRSEGGIRCCSQLRWHPKNVLGSLSVTRAYDHYQLLGLQEDADLEEIKAAFKRKALELHPDVNKEEGAPQMFMQCREAYETLSNAQCRSEYDRQQQYLRRRSAGFRTRMGYRRTQGYQMYDGGHDGLEWEEERGYPYHEEEPLGSGQNHTVRVGPYTVSMSPGAAADVVVDKDGSIFIGGMWTGAL